MWHKFLATVFAVICLNLLIFDVGLPSVGTIGFLVLINCLQLYLFVAYPANIHYPRHAYAGTLSLLAIIASTLALFRANQVALVMLGVSSLGMSVVALYLFSLTQSTFGAMSEFVLIPFTIVAAWLHAGFKLFTERVPELLVYIGKLSSKNNSNLSRENLMIKGTVILFPVVLILMGLVGLSSNMVYLGIERVIKSLGWVEFGLSQELRTRMAVSVLLLMGLYPLSDLRSSFNFASPFRRNFYQAMMIEVAMLVAAILVIASFFLVVQFRYYFLSGGLGQLAELGIFTFSDYVRRGFLELSIVASVVFGVSALSIMVLRAKDAPGKVLRGLNILLLCLLQLYAVAIFYRLFLYYQQNGLTRARVYGSFSLMLLVVLSVVLMFRFVKRKYLGWHVFEFAVMVFFLFGATLWDVDQTVVAQVPPRVNQQTDYVYISRLSADGVWGWLDAYGDAKKLIENLDMTSAVSLDDHQVREVIYAKDVLTNLRKNYWLLAERYGNPEIVANLSFVGHFDSEIETSLARQMAHTNLSEWNAYRILTSKVNSQELAVIEEKAVDLVPIVTGGKNYSLDRNHSAPLMW